MGASYSSGREWSNSITSLSAHGGESKSSKRSQSSQSGKSELTSHMIRERRCNVWDYYEEVSRLGEGSIGTVSLVRRRHGTEGGSAYKEREAEGCCGGVFGWLHVGTSMHVGDSLYVGDSQHTKEYAVKSIQLSLIKKEFVAELKNEISILRALDHPNIVKAFEVYESKRNVFVVMEHCSGGDLYARAPYSEGQARELVRQICSAIAHMHSKGVSHRDLKLENILFESREPCAQVKVLDFGLSKKFLPGDVMTEGVGTVYTMAPQVLQGVYTAKADCWSIGVVAFVLLSQEKPFKGRTRSHVVRRILMADYHFLAPAWRTISRNAKHFVSSLILHNPAKRLSAAQALNHPWLSNSNHATDNAQDTAIDNCDQDMNIPPTDSLMDNVKENISAYANMSELRRIAAVIIAHKSSTAEIIDIRKAFDQYDTEKDGMITFDEFKNALAKFDYSDEDLHLMFTQMDIDDTGVVLYTEFIAATLELHGRVEEKRLAEAFDLIDDDDSGFISKENLRKLLGQNVPPDRIDKLIQQADTNGDGLISFEEFIDMFRKDNDTVVKEAEVTSIHVNDNPSGSKSQIEVVA